MLKIRMQRTGRINSPSYRVVVAEHARSTKTGNIVEKVGTYDPKSKARVLNEERIKYWMSVGAKAPTEETPKAESGAEAPAAEDTPAA